MSPREEVPILEGIDLVKHFGSQEGFFRRGSLVRAVDNVTLAVKRGETFAIVGESGCGKSTLARLLLRLIEPTAGEVRFEGRPLTGVTGERLRASRRDMQMIFQDPYGSLNPRLSVGALVGEPLEVHRIASGSEREERVARLLRLVGLLPDHAARYPHEFSGGQRQRIGIARALACGPKLIVGDEPVSALDVSVRAQVINLLEDLKAQLGLTLVLVAHDLAVIRHTSDRVAVMYLGEIVELAAASALFDQPHHPYTQALMAAIPASEPSARRTRPLLEGEPPSPAAPPPGCRFHPRCAHAVDRCRRERPLLRRLTDAHAVACHRAEEVGFEARRVTREPAGGARENRIALFAKALADRGAGPIVPNSSDQP